MNMFFDYPGVPAHHLLKEAFGMTLTSFLIKQPKEISFNVFNLVSGCCFPLERLANGTKSSTCRSKGKIIVSIHVQSKFLSVLAW